MLCGETVVAAFERNIPFAENMVRGEWLNLRCGRGNWLLREWLVRWPSCGGGGRECYYNVEALWVVSLDDLW